MLQVSTPNQIAAAIDSHIRTHGGRYSDWYVGIAADPVNRLVASHNADATFNAAAYWNAGDQNAARAIEQFLIAKGCRGGDGGGGWLTKFVYVYRVSMNTRE